MASVAAPAHGMVAGTALALGGVQRAGRVATVRYDKLSTGATRLGPFASAPSSLGHPDFVDEASAAVDFLAGRTDIDAGHLIILDHSEGARAAVAEWAVGCEHPLRVPRGPGRPAQLDAVLPAATLTPLTLTTADHLLKDEPPGTNVTSVSDLAFSAELPPALASWLSTVAG